MFDVSNHFRLMVVVITLHNLSKQSSGLGCLGHFHFRTHITSFIDKNWEKLFGNDQRLKRKNLLGTIAGVLSQQSPEIFSSGTEIVGSSGWWKLTQRLTPLEHETFIKNRIKQSTAKKEEESNDEDDDKIAMKRIKLEPEELIPEDLNSFLDNEDDLLKEINQLQDELVASCGIKTESHISNDEDAEIEDFAGKHPKEVLEVESVKKSDVLSWSQRKHKLRVELKSQNSKGKVEVSEPSQLDRYCTFYRHPQQSLLAGPTTFDLFQSPYSGQTLHPIIYRDKKIFPKWLKLMCEVKHAVSGESPDRSSINFCYVKAHHIPAINSLLQATFWPGIDMSEALSYPDFTIVALYKKLVIGCAFLVPDACHNEAYISFLAVRPSWERSGIASFMLYHLTQTSHGKDITLHISATNPAICLYQKFGFKTEELILDFYEKYLPIDSPHSPHALFLRLTR